jgi:hypothetical protein
MRCDFAFIVRKCEKKTRAESGHWLMANPMMGNGIDGVRSGAVGCVPAAQENKKK